MASKGGSAGVARGVANAIVGASRKAALLILDVLDGLARAMENAHKEEERDAADAVQIDSKQPENERALIETASDGREFDEPGSLSTPCEAMLPCSLVLERLWPTGFSTTKTKFFVLDEAGQEQYVIECVNYEKARKDNHATL